MGKRKKKPHKKRSTLTARRVMSGAEISYGRESRYIVDCARRLNARVVTLGSLFFFSTENGDAWVLDLGDKSALCLDQEGEVQPYRIVQTDTHFAIDRNATYSIRQDVFLVGDETGRLRLFSGYPVEHIIDAERRTRP